MSYKVILVYLDDANQSDIPIEIAANIAHSQDALLTGLAISKLQDMLVHSRTTLTSAGAGVAPYAANAGRRLQDAFQRFDEVTRKTNLGSVDKISIEGDIVEGIGSKARYCDLLIIPNAGNSYEAGSGPDVAKIVMNCGVPVLLIPPLEAEKNLRKTIMIAWDGSASATKSMHGAIPLLKRAAKVQVMIINPQNLEKNREEQPGASLVAYLQKHGISTHVTTRDTTDDIGMTLLSAAKEGHVDLLVMGCYGHAPLREKLFGGVTQTILRSMNLPVLMSY